MATRLTDQEIDEIARKIAADISRGCGGAAPASAAGYSSPSPAYGSALGVFSTVNEAVAAAKVAQVAFAALKLEQRGKIIEAIRATMRENGSALAKAAHDETGFGRYEDKVMKNALVTERTPGLEDLQAAAITGDNGLTLTEPAPFGVIGAITPVTNPTSTIICNSIGMLAAGNSVVYNVHPYAKNCCMQTIESAQELMKHPGVRLVVVTGGGEVVKVAMTSGKRAICAGPGNPPVVIDETADIGKAAHDIIMGSSTDNNIISTDEKETIVVASVADALLNAMSQSGL